MAGKSNLLTTYKKETNLNLGLLHKLHPMLPVIAQQIFNENGLEKPTQNLFNHVTYYLMYIIAPQVHASLTWPLYDSKGERAYRSELSLFIAQSAAKGLFTPVMSSYLVHPGCFKVTVLLFQMSQLAVKRMLSTKIKDDKKMLYDNVTEKYNTPPGRSFIEHLNELSYENSLLQKLTNYLNKKQHKERIAEMLRRKITEMEYKLCMLKPQAYLDELVDNFISKNEFDDSFKCEILEIKNVNGPSKIFDNCLMETDRKLDALEAIWDNKVVGFLEKCRHMQCLTEAIVKRYTGQIETSSYTVEYDPKNDMIYTDELESQVNSEQKFILRNLQNDGRLSFPNLIRAFLISICFIFKNNEEDDSLYSFNEHLDNYKKSFKDALSALRMLIERVSKAENRLKASFVAIYVSHVSTEEYFQIPELPNLSDLKMNRDQYYGISDTLTPLNISKYQFNLSGRTSHLARAQPKSVLPLQHQVAKVDFMKTLISSRVSPFDHANNSNNSHYLSISTIKANETIAECSSGFTRQQITRLLSNKKSSCKKYRNKYDHQDLKVKKGSLFNESIISSDSQSLFRCYSSPNLLENREIRSYTGICGRKLSVMHEDPQNLEVSGIACLDSNFNSQVGLENAGDSNVQSSSPIKVDVTYKGKNIMRTDSNQNLDIISPIFSVVMNKDSCTSETETPKGNTVLTKKTDSMEKLINRFKKVRASTMPFKDTAHMESLQKHPIVEEKEHLKLDAFAANRNLLQDLSNSSITSDYDEFERRNLSD